MAFECSNHSHSATCALSSAGQSCGFLIRESQVRILESVPYAQMVERKTRQLQELVPDRACEFKSRSVHHKYAPLVQLVEHRTFNAVVRSSSLRRRTILLRS